MDQISELLESWIPMAGTAPEMEWLAGGFELAQRHLGLGWFRETQARLLGKDCRCMITASHVAGLGWMLAQVQDSANFEALRRKIAAANDYTVDCLPYPIVELQGICLLDSAAPGSRIEYEPTAPGHTTTRVADASFSWPDGTVVYLEVARRTESQKDRLVDESIQVVSRACRGMVPPGLAAQVHLTRMATDSDAQEIARTLREGPVWESPRTELPHGTGRLIVSRSDDGSAQVIGTPGGEETPGSRVSFPREAGAPGLLWVSMESSDDSIEGKSLSEASQLPLQFPGIVLIQRCSGTRGSATWINRIRNEFDNVNHRRPSGAWTFFRDDCHIPIGGVQPYILAGAINPSAARPLPTAVANGLRAMADKNAENWAARYPSEL